MRRRGEIDGSVIVTVAIILIVCAAVGGVVFGAFVQGTASQLGQDQAVINPRGQSSQSPDEWHPSQESVESAQPNQTPSSYVGYTEQTLLADFGTPRSATPQQDGNSVWFYQWDGEWAEFTINSSGFVVKQRREVGFRD